MTWLMDAGRQLRLRVRTLSKNPGFAAVAGAAFARHVVPDHDSRSASA